MPAARVATLLALCLHATGTNATGLDPPLFTFSGFGTLAIVHSSEDQADFVVSPSKPRGAGFSRSASAEGDSLVAAQVTLRPHPRVSAVVQVISEQDPDRTFRPHVEWANVRYQVTPELAIRIGRTVLPILMLTESRKVGFANPWVRPPPEVYGLVPVTNNDGLDASYRGALGAATNTVQVTAGRSDPRFPAASGTTRIEVRRVVLFSDTLEHGFATLRMNFGRARVTVPQVNVLFDNFRQFGTEGAAIADRYEAKGTPVSFVGAGASFDPGPWFVMGEWTRMRSTSALGTRTAWYAGGGLRVGRATPYALHARARADDLSDPGLRLSGLPADLAVAGAGLNAALNSTLATKPVQSTTSLGVRWDAAKNVALKLQFDRTRLDPRSTGTLRNIQPAFQPGGKVDVWTASMDFVFR